MNALVREYLLHRPLRSLSSLASSPCTSRRLVLHTPTCTLKPLPAANLPFQRTQLACANVLLDRVYSPRFSRPSLLTGFVNQSRWLSSQGGGENNAKEEGKQDASRRNRSLLTGAGLLAVLAGKGKWVLAAAKLTKFSSLISMLATTCTYALFFGFPYAFGMVSLIAIHEAVCVHLV